MIAKEDHVELRDSNEKISLFILKMTQVYPDGTRQVSAVMWLDIES